jgi:polar amino acid transport system substrate-binding protein
MLLNRIRKERKFGGFCRISAIAILVPLLLMLASCGSASVPAEPADKPDPISIKVGHSSFAYPPLHYRDKSDKLVGFDIDLATEALALMDAKPVFVPIDWAERAELLEAGEVDMLWGGLERASLDESKVKFTKSYLRSDIVLVMGNESDFAKFEDLEGMNVCALNFTPAFYYLQVFNRDVIRSKRAYTPPEYQELLSALPSGSYDCVIADISFASFLLKAMGADYKMSGTVMGSNYAVAVRIGDTELFESLQEALDKLEADGTTAQLQEKWIN